MEGPNEPAPPSGPPSPPLPPRPPGRVRRFACPSCGGTVTLRAVGQSISAQCAHCSSLIDVADESLAIIVAANQAAMEAELPLGARGRLDGTEWEVIGHQRRRTEDGDFFWTEYLLFNPYHGYRFLIEEEGHWTIARTLQEDVPGIGSDSVRYDGDTFQRFSQGAAVTHAIGGEFYWRAAVGDHAQTMDYVAPPRRLFAERTGEEIIVSIGNYIAVEDVEQAFAAGAARLPPEPVEGLESSAPGPAIPPAGGKRTAFGKRNAKAARSLDRPKLFLSRPRGFTAGPNQPNPYTAMAKTAWFLAIIALAAACLVQMVGAILADNETVAQVALRLRPDDKGRDRTLAQFRLPSDGNVEIDTAAALNNDWLEMELSLVNIGTQQSYDTVAAMEYYSGTDSDGAWSEGDPTSAILFSSIPAGEYKLVASPDAGSLGAGLSGRMTVRRDVMTWSNFWLAALLILVFPVYATVRAFLFERTRWANSGSSEEE